jgi:superfamily I DNA/RNA helicase
MHRVKGLEFEHVIIVAANQGILPLDAAVVDAEDAVAKRNADTGERSLLYVALTRARRSATITGLRSDESICGNGGPRRCRQSRSGEQP